MRLLRSIVTGSMAALVVAPSFAQDCPTFVGVAAPPSCCVYDVAVSGSYAYVTVSGLGLRVIDVSTPSDPVEVGFIDTPGRAGGVAVFATHAYVADGPEGLRVIDVSTPSSPVEVGFIDIPESWTDSVTVSGRYAYVGESHGFRVIDVSTPSGPVEVGSFGLQEGALDVVVADHYAYVVEGTWFGGLRVVNVSTPSSPVEVGSLDIRVPLGVDVSGHFAYVAATDGLWVIDISTPADPMEVSLFETSLFARNVAISGNHAFVVKDEHPGDSIGLLVIDVSDPPSPVEVGNYDLECATSVTVKGRYLYVTELGKGLNIFSPAGCPGFVPQPPAPRRPSGRMRP